MNIPVVPEEVTNGDKLYLGGIEAAVVGPYSCLAWKLVTCRGTNYQEASTEPLWRLDGLR